MIGYMDIVFVTSIIELILLLALLISPGES